MARSSYIYVVLHTFPNCTHTWLVTAFTVKHELKMWWKLQTESYKDQFSVRRIRDGETKFKSIPRSELE